MKFVLHLITIVILSSVLTSCFVAAVAAVGAGGGYIYEKEHNKNK